MGKFDIREWVDKSQEHRALRQAIHTVLIAISGTPELQLNMIMKGGILLALSYESTRFTADIDFSTPKRREDFDLEAFIGRLKTSLSAAVDRLDYGLNCMVQGYEQKPPRTDATFPTIRIRIGYAEMRSKTAHRKLLAGKSPKVVEVDYSLNEPVGTPELFEIDEEHAIRTYSFWDLAGEKYRAVLQQEVRNRFRRQDIYDLYFLLTDHPNRNDPGTKALILASLIERAAARNLPVNQRSMRDSEIRRRSERDYGTLRDEIEGELPHFDRIYEAVKAYYESLPWKV